MNKLEKASTPLLIIGTLTIGLALAIPSDQWPLAFIGGVFIGLGLLSKLLSKIEDDNSNE